MYPLFGNKYIYLFQVVLNKLQDEQLALVIIRMYEGELEAVPPTLCKLLYTVSIFEYICMFIAHFIKYY